MKSKFFLLIFTAFASFLFVACSEDDKPTPQVTSFKILDEELAIDRFGIGFRLNDIALGLEVQKIMDGMIADGKAAEISIKWFGYDVILRDQQFLKDTNVAAADQSLANVLAKGNLIIGGDLSYAPMFFSEQGTIKGFDVDIAMEVAKRLGVELIKVPLNWDNKENSLNAGNIDAIWCGLSITTPRLESMFIPKAYMNNRFVVIVPENSTIKNISDLENKIVGIQKGGATVDAFLANPVHSKISKLEELSTNLDIFNELKAGKIDAGIMDESVARYLISTNK